MKKRIFSMLLACLMLLSSVPMLVLAADGEAEVAFTSSFYEEAQAGKITYDAEQEKVSYNGDWQAVILAANTYTPILLDRMNPRVEDEGLWAITPIAHDGITKNNWSQWWWGSLPGSGCLNLEDYSIGFSNPQGITAYQYTVKQEGKFDIAIEIDNYTAPADANSEFYLTIMVNGKMVWPKYGATYSYASSGDATQSNPAYVTFKNEDGGWYKVEAATTVEQLNEALDSLSVKAEKGAVISVCYRLASQEQYARIKAIAMPKITATVSTSDKIDQYLTVRENGMVLSTTKIEGGVAVLPEYTGSAMFLGWDLNGDGVADAKAGAQIDATQYDTDIIAADAVTVGISSFMDNLPVLDADNNPQYLGDWQLGAYDKAAGTFNLFASPADAYGIISTNGSVWGGQGGGLYTGTGKIAFSGCEAGESFMTEIRYTAPYNGDVSFGLNKMDCRREVNSDIEDYIAYNFAVYLNGKKIWPADSDFFALKSPTTYTARSDGYDALADFEAAGFPLSLQLKKGDVLSLRMQEGNENSWMMFADPVVTYNTLQETPMATSCGLTLGTDLALSFYAQIVAPRDGVQMGMECWTSEPTADMLAAGGTKLEGGLDESTGFYVFTYGGLTAKQMTDLVYVRPYSYVGEDVIYGDVKGFSIQMYAESALGQNKKLDDVLVALLNYGSKAQALFGYNVANSASANLSEEQKRATADIGSLVDVYNNEDGANKIKNVSLIMGTDIGMKYMIDSVEGATTYELEVSKNADFSDSTKIAMEAVWEGKEQKAIYNISFAELGDTFYVRAVVDGEAGAVLTYSVDSYIIRISENCSDGLYFTAMSLAYLGQMIEAYNA